MASRLRTGTRLLRFAVLLLLNVVSSGAASNSSLYAHGSHRSGLHLAGVTPILSRSSLSHLQCLNLCGHEPTCRALQISGSECHLLADTACDGQHPLQACDEPDCHYYDVYRQATQETTLSLWNHPSCEQQGYCAAGCLADAVGDFCLDDVHCEAFRPPGAYRCVDGVCALGDDFWEVRAGLVLPRWMDWTVSPVYPSFKKLLPDTCTVNVRIRLGEGATLLLGAATQDFKFQQRHMLAITPDKTQILAYAESSRTSTVVTETDTTGMISSDPSVWSSLTFSWCDGTLAIGPELSPSLVTAQVTSFPEPAFLMTAGEVGESQLQLERGAADPWLLEPAGTSADPVFDIAAGTLVSRRITPSNDVTVKYDCQGSRDCSVYLSSDDPNTLLGITIGGWDNDKSAIQYYHSDRPGSNFGRTDTGPVMDASAFTTFTVRYTAGAVTVHVGDDPVAVFSVQAPEPLPTVTTVSVGSMWHEGTRKQVRLARYDPGWRTDTWLTDGNGFSNMALQQ